MVFIPAKSSEQLTTGFFRKPVKPPTPTRSADGISSSTKRQQKRQKANHRRSKREASDAVFEQAKNLAKNNGMLLTRCNGKTYNLESPTGWLLTIRPGSRGLHYDEKRRGPLFHVADDWNVLDVVQAMIQSVELQ